jgi:integrase
MQRDWELIRKILLAVEANPPGQTVGMSAISGVDPGIEVDKLLQASSKLGRHGARDRTLILLAYRHGLRVSELVALRWDQVDLKAGLLHVARLKNGIASTHPIRGPEPMFCTL